MIEFLGQGRIMNEASEQSSTQTKASYIAWCGKLSPGSPGFCHEILRQLAFMWWSIQQIKYVCLVTCRNWSLHPTWKSTNPTTCRLRLYLSWRMLRRLRRLRRLRSFVSKTPWADFPKKAWSWHLKIEDWLAISLLVVVVVMMMMLMIWWWWWCCGQLAQNGL